MQKKVSTHHIKIEKTAHFYTLGELNASTKHIYIILHGYGQLASRLVQKFSHLGEDVFAIAPEALSRFYWDGTTGQVGASWMTKADRESEIEDYCDYIQQVYEQFLPQIPQNCKVHLFGFSQGGATAMRWAMLRQAKKLDSIILWASDTPPDLPYKELKTWLDSKQLFWVYGHQDEFLSPKRIQQLENRLEKFQLDPTVITFDGKHVVDRPTLLDLHQQLG